MDLSQRTDFSHRLLHLFENLHRVLGRIEFCNYQQHEKLAEKIEGDIENLSSFNHLICLITTKC